MTAKSRKPAGPKKRVNLALQGGGAHGAFTWGVLDHLLADGRLEIEGISGTSAGALNAIMVADGLARGGPDKGPEEARKRLAAFWRATSLDGSLTAGQRSVFERLHAFMPAPLSAMSAFFDTMSRYFSPYELNPLDINPLRSLVEEMVDFDAIRACTRLQLFISTTNVQSGRLKVFSRDALTPSVIAASACLPFLFQAVEIDGVPYWDGGYVANPALFPFFQSTTTEDVIVVEINPDMRLATPRTAQEIYNRINEISFNASLRDEYRAIHFVRRMIDAGRLPRGTGPGEYRRINMHRIGLDVIRLELAADSKMSADFAFFTRLHKAGVKAAKTFLDHHFDSIGHEGTLDLGTETPAEWAGEAGRAGTGDAARP